MGRWVEKYVFWDGVVGVEDKRGVWHALVVLETLKVFEQFNLVQSIINQPNLI